MKTLLTATAISVMMLTGAHAACNVTVGSSLANPFTETDCASAATVATQGADIATLQANDAAQDATLTAHGAAIASHTATLADHETRIATGEAKDVEQDARHDTAEAKNTEQDGRLDGHDTTLATHTGQIAQGVAHDAVQDGRLGSLETVTAGHGATLNAHSALLSAHSAKLDDHSRGLAIAMAMPDAWLSDKKQFGIFGSVGGFDDETAIGFAAIGRIDETWSLNAKLGTDIEGKNFGWQVGAGAQW
jgi:hypothetical protein